MDIQEENAKMICAAYGHEFMVARWHRNEAVLYKCKRCGILIKDALTVKNAENAYITKKGHLEIRKITAAGKVAEKFNIF
jgi:hypothetical protein